MGNALAIRDITVEHMHTPLGIDCTQPRFGWKLESTERDVRQTACRVLVRANGAPCADTGRVESDESIEVMIPGWKSAPMTRYEIELTVWDNHGHAAQASSWFETGRMGVPFQGRWVEPEQESTPHGSEPWRTASGERSFAEFRPAQYIRIPFAAKGEVRRARIYATAHGVYQLMVNGARPDDRELAPECSAYQGHLLYQTYDVTALLRRGENVFGAILGDGWWIGRLGVPATSCQYGDRLALLLEAEIEYADGTAETVTAERGVSSVGPILYSDLYVGESYDATRELTGWELPGYDDSAWRSVQPVDFAMDNLAAQSMPPVRVVRTLEPKEILTTPAGETILDVGQVVAGVVEFTLSAPAGVEIALEHSEILDEKGNYYNNIIGVNKEQTIRYVTRGGAQTYRPHFTFQGFRYVRVTGWPGEISTRNFRVLAFSSEMEDLASFETSDSRLNQLQSNIWWSQVANTISIPTDCPQREKVGWTGDILVYAPTMCFLRGANAFLDNWMASVRADQRPDGAVPSIVPFLKCYEDFLTEKFDTPTSSGWGDAVIFVPLAVHQAYGDKRILRENYGAMVRWMEFILDRCANHHPAGYENWDEARRSRSRLLWNTDFHFGDWLIPSMVLGNPDGEAMEETAFATMAIVAPAFTAFSVMKLREVAQLLGEMEDVRRWSELYERMRRAFIEEYIHEDATMDGDFQGLYVLALRAGLVPEALRERMVDHLCELIDRNGGCLDTGFLGTPYLLDVLCENGRRDVALQLLFQTKCPSWLYEVEQGATTIWESWGATAEDGTVSTYSYNHYAFGCVGDWMYRELGGLRALEPGCRRMRIAPALDCGLSRVRVAHETPYGRACVEWNRDGSSAVVRVEIPANTEAEVRLPGMDVQSIGSGSYVYSVNLNV